MVAVLEVRIKTGFGGKMTDHLLSGTVLKGKYTIESLLENSDFSNIYTGRSGSKEIIVKECFPKSLVIRGSDREVFTIKNKENFDLIKKSFVSEAQILGNLNHANVVKIYDKFRYKNTYYIIMEMCKGSTLKKFILNNDLSEEEVKTLFLKIIKAVKYIHKQGYIHRDIKPSNIMIKGRTLKILDFGSTIDKRSRNAEYVRVTSGYSPMEMYSLKSINNESTDIYSLCALLYFMLYKQKPMDVLKRFYYSELIFGEDTAPVLKTVIEKGLMIDSKDRYQSIVEIEKILKN